MKNDSSVNSDEIHFEGTVHTRTEIKEKKRKEETRDDCFVDVRIDIYSGFEVVLLLRPL